MAKKKQQKLPMYLSKLVVKNIKCFGSEQELDLKNSDGTISPWTLILGDNGIGKTTLLKCIALMTPIEERSEVKKKEEKISGIAIKPIMDDLENVSEFESLIRNNKTIQANILATYSNGIALKQKPNKANEVTIGMQLGKKEGKLVVINPKYGELQNFTPPIIYAYNASRHMAIKNYEKSELQSPISNLFSLSGDLYDTEQLLPMLELAALKKNETAKKLLEKVKTILADILPGVESSENIIIESPFKTDGTPNPTQVQVKSRFGVVPLFNLSLGYQTMMALTVDLTLRMLWNNPQSPDPLEEPAIVLIDEIDLHLHPKWQRSVREKLTQHFKNTQFICTAHSPFMAQDSELENLCVIQLSGNEVTIENLPAVVKGWRIGQIITSDLFGIESERSPEVEAMAKERSNILDKKKLTAKDKIRLEYLDNELNKLPVTEDTENQKMLDEIANLTKLIKNEKKK